jgi:tol-pal system protein YbgF
MNSSPLFREGLNLFHKKRISYLSSLFSIFLILLLMLSACASTEDVGRVQYELYDLEKEVKDLKSRSSTIEREIPKGQKELEGAKSSQEATARSVSNLFIKTQDLSNEIRDVTGRIEEMQYSYEQNRKDDTEKMDMMAAEQSRLESMLEDIRSKLDGLKSDIKKVSSDTASLRSDMSMLRSEMEEIRSEQEFLGEKITTPTGARRIPPPKKGSKNAAVQTAKTIEEQEKVDVKEAYNTAYGLYEAGNFKDAREKFDSVLQDFKENEYSDNARFWIGECHFKEGMYDDAILAFEELFEKNPDSDKISSAKLKQGLAFYELGDPETGEHILKSLINLFPDSKDALTAKKKLGIASTF